MFYTIMDNKDVFDLIWFDQDAGIPWEVFLLVTTAKSISRIMFMDTFVTVWSQMLYCSQMTIIFMQLQTTSVKNSRLSMHCLQKYIETSRTKVAFQKNKQVYRRNQRQHQEWHDFLSWEDSGGACHSQTTSIGAALCRLHGNVGVRSGTSRRAWGEDSHATINILKTRPLGPKTAEEKLRLIMTEHTTLASPMLHSVIPPVKRRKIAPTRPLWACLRDHHWGTFDIP